MALWLWFTVLFANFAEALAEGRSKAQAASLRGLKQEAWAKKLLEPHFGAQWKMFQADDLRNPPSRQDIVDRIFKQWPDYAMAALGCGLAGLVAAALFPIFELPNIVMIFLLAMVLASMRFGRGPGVLASYLSVAIFDFVFVPPRFYSPSPMSNT